MRSLRSDIHHNLKHSPRQFQWPVHAALLRKLSKVVDIKSEARNTPEMNGKNDLILEVPTPKKTVTLADVSVNTGKSLTEDSIDEGDAPVYVKPSKTTLELSTQKKEAGDHTEERKLHNDNVTVEIKHNITPKKSSLKLDLKKSTSQLSASLLNISSQIKSVTTHKRIVSTTGPKKSQPQLEMLSKKDDAPKACNSQHGTPKSLKSSRPLVNTKSPNVLIYSDSVVARDNLEASLRKILDCERYAMIFANVL